MLMRRKFCFVVAALSLGMATSLRAQWRDRWQQPERIMDSVRVTPWMIVGEVGAGEGYFTFKLAERVGPEGRVYANDIVRRVLDTIKRKCETQGVDNIVTVLGRLSDPGFPVDSLDMVVMVYSFHEIGQPVRFLNQTTEYMKSGARLIIIDRDPDKFGGEYGHFLTKKQVVELIEKSDLTLERILTFLSRDNVYVCAREE